MLTEKELEAKRIKEFTKELEKAIKKAKIEIKKMRSEEDNKIKRDNKKSLTDINHNIKDDLSVMRPKA